MWLETQLGGFVQLTHVGQLIPVMYGDERGAAVNVAMASGAEQVLETGFASEQEAQEAIRAVLHLARLADQGLARTITTITFREALAGQRRLLAAVRDQQANSSFPPAPEGNSSFPPAPPAPPGLSREETERADAVLADAAEHARTINAAATGDDAAAVVAPGGRPGSLVDRGAYTAPDPRDR